PVDGILVLIASSPAFVSGGQLFGGPKARLPPRRIQIPESSRGSNFFPFTSTELGLAAGLADCAAAFPVARCPPPCARANSVTLGRALGRAEKASTNPRNANERSK